MIMKKILILFGILMAAILATSCRTTYNVSLQPDLEGLFIGRTYAEIIDVLGAPERTTADGRDGEIIIYEDVKLHSEGFVNPWTRNISLVTESSKGYIHMYINPDNVCYQVRTNREKQVSEFSKGKTIGLAAGLGGGALIIITSALLNRKKNN